MPSACIIVNLIRVCSLSVYAYGLCLGHYAHDVHNNNCGPAQWADKNIKTYRLQNNKMICDKITHGTSIYIRYRTEPHLHETDSTQKSNKNLLIFLMLVREWCGACKLNEWKQIKRELQLWVNRIVQRKFRASIGCKWISSFSFFFNDTIAFARRHFFSLSHFIILSDRIWESKMAYHICNSSGWRMWSCDSWADKASHAPYDAHSDT